MALNWKLGDPNANSYVATAFANTYLAGKTNPTAWTNLNSTQKDNVLLQAAIDIDMNNFQGSKYYEAQRMQFPRDSHEVYTGNCASPGPKNFKSTSLYNSTYNEIPNNYFKDGTVHITLGDDAGDIQYVASSLGSNGMVYTTASFTASITSSSQFLLFRPLDYEIRRAQCEQAFYIVDSDLVRYKEFKAQGISSVTIGDAHVSLFRGTLDSSAAVTILGFMARRYLSRYLRKNVRLGRA